MTNKEQLDFFLNSGRFTVEPLSRLPREINPHAEMVKHFRNDHNDFLQNFIRGDLQNYEWEAWDANNTDHIRVYLVIDNKAKEKDPVTKVEKETRRVIFYFGLSNGLVNDRPPKLKNASEQKIADTVEMLRMRRDRSMESRKNQLRGWDPEQIASSVKIAYDSSSGVNKAYASELKPIVNAFLSILKEYQEQEEEIYRLANCDDDTKQRIQEVVTYKMECKQDEYDDRIEVKEDPLTVNYTHHSYPAIELTHFVKDESYEKPSEIKLKLSDMIFWEIILKKIMDIRDQTGLQYVYLFAVQPTKNTFYADAWEEEKQDLLQMEAERVAEEAAEQTAGQTSERAANQSTNVITDSLDKIRNKPKKPRKKLLAFYRRRYGFMLVKDKALTKPHYDYGCFGMLQSVDMLEQLRTTKWRSHIQETEL